MIENQLLQLGFTKNEIKVYLALFELGKVRAGEIIETTGLHRNIIYTALESLIKRELVTKTIVKGVAEFVANSPNSLVGEIENKKQIAEQVAEELKKKQKETPREVIVYEGNDGLKRSRRNMLQFAPGNTMRVIGSKASSTPEMEKYWRHFHKQRDKKGINLEIMYEHGVDQQDLDWRNSLEHSKAKYLPMNIDLPIWFAFIKDYLEIGIPGDDPLTFAIRSKEAVGAFEKFFEYFWNQDVLIETGLDALERFIYDMLHELNPGDEYFVLGASVGVENDPGQQLYDKFHKDRVKKGVITNMLVYHESYDLIKKRFEKSGDPEGRISRLKKFTSAPPIPMQINVYNGKTRFILYGKEPTVIYFDRPEIYQGFKNYFDALWVQDTHVVSGAEAVKQLWLESIETGELKFIGARGYFLDRYPAMFAEIEKKAREKKGLKWKNVVDVSAKNNKLNKLPWMEAHFTLRLSKNPNVIWLWGKKAAIANWTEDEPVVFISENKHLVQSYEDYFDELWRQK